MDINRAAVTDEIPAPDTFKDELTREHLAAVFGEEEQQFIFLWLDLQRLIIEENFAAGEIDNEIVKD